MAVNGKYQLHLTTNGCTGRQSGLNAIAGISHSNYMKESMSLCIRLITINVNPVS